ncbi:MAG: hypothetical protein ACJ744_00495 [Gaiellaceae bacterium]
MRKLSLLLIAFVLGVGVAACGGSNKPKAPHLPPPSPSTGTTGIVQGHETTTRATTTG